MPVPIPASHRDLLDGPIPAVFTTMMPDGQPQSTLVWCDVNDDGLVRINTTRERQKAKNVAANPKVSLLVIDPSDPGRWIEIRGEAMLTEEGALAHLDGLTRLYTPHPRFYGYVYPAEARRTQTRVICLIAPTKINLDAIH
jgi:PPOX class probable F420-dependent enzyme